MKRKRKFLYIILCAKVATASWATAMADTFSDAVDAVVATNSELKASRLQAIADHLERMSANRLAPVEVEGEYLMASDVPNRYSISVTQEIDWPGAYRARSKANASLTAADNAAADALELNIRSEVASAAITIISINRSIGLLTEASQQAHQLLDALTDGYSKGSISVLDVNKMRIETANIDASLAEARSELDATLASLTAYSSDPEAIRVLSSLTEFPALTLEQRESYQRALMYGNPAIESARRAAEAAGRLVSAARAEALPGFSVGYRLEREEGVTFNGFGVGLKLPVWSASATLRAANAARLSAQMAERSAVEQATAALDADYARASALREIIENYGNALVVTDNLGLLRQAFDSRHITLTDYINDTRFFIEANIKLHELQSEYYTLLTRLEYTSQAASNAKFDKF